MHLIIICGMQKHGNSLSLYLRVMSRYHCWLKSLYHLTPATMSSDSEVSHFPDPDHGVTFGHSHLVSFPELLRAT